MLLAAITEELSTESQTTNVCSGSLQNSEQQRHGAQTCSCFLYIPAEWCLPRTAKPKWNVQGEVMWVRKMDFSFVLSEW